MESSAQFGRLSHDFAGTAFLAGCIWCSIRDMIFDEEQSNKHRRNIPGHGIKSIGNIQGISDSKDIQAFVSVAV